MKKKVSNSFLYLLLFAFIIISCIVLLYYHIIYKSKRRRANELENTFDINNNEEKNVNGNEPLIK